MTSLALSVLLALVSSVCYAAGAILQEHVAATTPLHATGPLRRGSWWTAVTLNGAGAVLHVIALAYGPLSVVQPLGALTIVFALPMAAVFVRRPVGAAGWRGALLATAGLAGLLSLTGSSRSQALADGERITLAVVTLSAIAALALVARLLRPGGLRGVVLATAAGTSFGVSSVFVKNVAVEGMWGSWADVLPSLVMIGCWPGAGCCCPRRRTTGPVWPRHSRRPRWSTPWWRRRWASPRWASTSSTARRARCSRCSRRWWRARGW